MAIFAESVCADPAASHADLIQQIQTQQLRNHSQQQAQNWNLEWNNQNPQQRQALDTFYQSLHNRQNQQAMDRLQRQQNIEQLQQMSPQQRYQRFHDFVQDRGIPTPHR